jgi:hypothetical protein
MLAQSRAAAGRIRPVVARVGQAAVAADAAVAGVVGGSIRAANERVIAVARRVAEIAIRIHVLRTAVHGVLVAVREHRPQRRRIVREGAVAVRTAVVVALVRLGGSGRQEDERACGRDQY